MEKHFNFKDRTGESHLTNQGYVIEIIECFSSQNCTVKFADGTVIKNIAHGNIIKGKVANPYHPSVNGKGFIGVGEYVGSEDNKPLVAYTKWQSMLARCYSEKSQVRLPTYIGVKVYEKWHNFQNFAEWFYENYNPEIMEGWCLDKDILIKGNKIYSPETCCFVPQEINLLFVNCRKSRGDCPIGVIKNKDYFVAQFKKCGKNWVSKRYKTPEEAFEIYKTIKEAYIKEVADKWRGQITKECYEAMYNYKIEIYD